MRRTSTGPPQPLSPRRRCGRRFSIVAVVLWVRQAAREHRQIGRGSLGGAIARTSIARLVPAPKRQSHLASVQGSRPVRQPLTRVRPFESGRERRSITGTGAVAHENATTAKPLRHGATTAHRCAHPFHPSKQTVGARLSRHSDRRSLKKAFAMKPPGSRSVKCVRCRVLLVTKSGALSVLQPSGRQRAPLLTPARIAASLATERSRAERPNVIATHFVNQGEI